MFFLSYWETYHFHSNILDVQHSPQLPQNSEMQFTGDLDVNFGIRNLNCCANSLWLTEHHFRFWSALISTVIWMQDNDLIFMNLFVKLNFDFFTYLSLLSSFHPSFVLLGPSVLLLFCFVLVLLIWWNY